MLIVVIGSAESVLVSKRAGDPVSVPVLRSPPRADFIAWSEVASLQGIRRMEEDEIYHSNRGRGTEVSGITTHRGHKQNATHS